MEEYAWVTAVNMRFKQMEADRRRKESEERSNKLNARIDALLEVLRQSSSNGAANSCDEACEQDRDSPSHNLDHTEIVDSPSKIDDGCDAFVLLPQVEIAASESQFDASESWSEACPTSKTLLTRGNDVEPLQFPVRITFSVVNRRVFDEMPLRNEVPLIDLPRQFRDLMIMSGVVNTLSYTKIMSLLNNHPYDPGPSTLPWQSLQLKSNCLTQNESSRDFRHLFVKMSSITDLHSACSEQMSMFLREDSDVTGLRFSDNEARVFSWELLVIATMDTLKNEPESDAALFPLLESQAAYPSTAKAHSKDFEFPKLRNSEVQLRFPHCATTWIDCCFNELIFSFVPPPLSARYQFKFGSDITYFFGVNCRGGNLGDHLPLINRIYSFGICVLKSSFAFHDELAGVLMHGEMKLAKLLNSKLDTNILHLLTNIATEYLLFSISDEVVIALASNTKVLKGQILLDIISPSKGLTMLMQQETQIFLYSLRDTQPSTTFDMFNSLLMKWLFNPSFTKDFVAAFVPIFFASVLENTLRTAMLKFIFYVQTFIVVVTIAVCAIKNNVDAAINWFSTFKNAPDIFQPIEGDIMLLIQQVAADLSKQFYYASHHVRIKQQNILPIDRKNWDPGEAGYFVHTNRSLQLGNMLNFSVGIAKIQEDWFQMLRQLRSFYLTISGRYKLSQLHCGVILSFSHSRLVHAYFSLPMFY